MAQTLAAANVQIAAEVVAISAVCSRDSAIVKIPVATPVADATPDAAPVEQDCFHGFTAAKTTVDATMTVDATADAKCAARSRDCFRERVTDAIMDAAATLAVVATRVAVVAVAANSVARSKVCFRETIADAILVAAATRTVDAIPDVETAEHSSIVHTVVTVRAAADCSIATVPRLAALQTDISISAAVVQANFKAPCKGSLLEAAVAAVAHPVR